MIHILELIYSRAFFLGSIATALLLPVYWKQKARWQDRHDPDAAPHHIDHISRVWIAAISAVLSLGYILLTAQTTQNQTIALTHNVARCWQESYQATKSQIKLNADNDLITRQQQGLQRQFDRATSDWLKALVNPPGDLVNQTANSPERQAYGLQITAQYQDKLNELGRQTDVLVNQRAELDDERKQHPLPEVTCGK